MTVLLCFPARAWAPVTDPPSDGESLPPLFLLHSLVLYFLQLRPNSEIPFCVSGFLDLLSPLLRCYSILSL